eukprot:356890-Chlamydomonas_euryale.AAC.7
MCGAHAWCLASRQATCLFACMQHAGRPHLVGLVRLTTLASGKPTANVSCNRLVRQGACMRAVCAAVFAMRLTAYKP